MPQGISSAPEEYQCRQNEALAGLNGVEVIADDILCYGSGETMEDAQRITTAIYGTCWIVLAA